MQVLPFQTLPNHYTDVETQLLDLSMIGQQLYFVPLVNQHIQGDLHLTADRLFLS
jgi:hypothetical protein